MLTLTSQGWSRNWQRFICCAQGRCCNGLQADVKCKVSGLPNRDGYCLSFKSFVLDFGSRSSVVRQITQVASFMRNVLACVVQACGALCLKAKLRVDAQQPLSLADTPPVATSILALSLRSFEALDDDGLLSMAQHAAGSGFLLTQILAQEHLRQRLLRQSKGRWHQHAVGAWR